MCDLSSKSLRGTYFGIMENSCHDTIVQSMWRTDNIGHLKRLVDCCSLDGLHDALYSQFDILLLYIPSWVTAILHTVGL